MVTLQLNLFFFCALTICIGAASQAGLWQKYSVPTCEIDTSSDGHEMEHCPPNLYVNHDLDATISASLTLFPHLESLFLLPTRVLAQLMQTNHLALPPPLFV